MKITMEAESRKGSVRVDVKLTLENFAPSFNLEAVKDRILTGTKKPTIVSNKKQVWEFIVDRSNADVKEALELYVSDIMKENLKLFSEYPEFNLSIVKEAV